MSDDFFYLMESEEETLRLELKTDKETVARQAQWAGLKPGMEVIDIGCGPGVTTFFLSELVLPGGRAVGLDASPKRIAHARERYGNKGVEFECLDVTGDLSGLGQYDFVWSRFFLEYHKTRSFEIVQKMASLLKPGGILCLVDLDYNCLTHYGFPERVQRTISGIVGTLEKVADFDPYAGRKLYSFLYDLGFQDIDVNLNAHHLIFGELPNVDAFNWTRKALIAGKDSGYGFEEYSGGFEEFFAEFERCFADPRRFTYTPVITCRGKKP